MKKDLEIQKNVMESLKWIPLLNANEIGVAVKNGVVTLSGIVDSYPTKIKIERVARKINGVRGIAEDIEVHLREDEKRTDAEISQAILYELKWHSNLKHDNITIHVEDGVVTLSGIVDWNFQRKAVGKTVSNIRGVRKINNNIILTRVEPTANLENKIKSVLYYYNLKPDSIQVKIEGRKVILSGRVNTWEERLEAEKIVWSAPGVDTIENNIECIEEEFV